MKYQLFDEDGIIGIVNGDKYNGFVSEDWELNELTELFVREMNAQNLIVWKAANYGNLWNIGIVESKTGNKAFREFERTIEVTSGELYLIDFTALSMIAQYNDISVKKECKSNQAFKMKNGIYKVTVKQMFDPNDFLADNDKRIHFEIVFEKTSDNKASSIDQVIWWEAE